MKQTRKIIIRDRIFSIDDLKRVASIFKTQQGLAKKADHHATTDFEIQFSDNTSVESDSTEILNDSVLTGPGRPVDVRFSFHNYSLNRRVSFAISHGDSTYGNIASVSADDHRWLSDIYVSLQNAIETAKPQTMWFRRHPGILLHLVALGAGSLMILVFTTIIQLSVMLLDLDTVITPTPDESKWKELLSRVAPLLYILIWFMRWMAGLPWAFDIRSWLLRLWPNIELDVGTEHLKVEKLQRRRLFARITMIVLPIITSVVYDAINYLPYTVACGCVLLSDRGVAQR